MGFANGYIKKYFGSHFQSVRFERNPALIVVIPCYNEPEISVTINSLYCCQKPKAGVGIIVVVNDSENSDLDARTQNCTTLMELEELKCKSPEWIELQVIHAPELPKKWAGAGWARKIGMDAAIFHFNKVENANGLIVSLDADALVASNYFNALEQHFRLNPQNVAATIYFEHPLEGKYPVPYYQGVALYELYMRYYKNALSISGFPHAMYTVGSCFVVTADAYIKQGGMNRKKAGEDFYFLHKLPPIGSVGEITSTMVIPSERPSNRVPFGTGPVLQKWLDGNRDLEQTYSFEAFLVLNQLFGAMNGLYKGKRLENAGMHPILVTFLIGFDFQNNLDLLIQNCGSVKVFRKRFFHLFNAFAVLKWLNFSAEYGFQKCDLRQQTIELLRYKAVLEGKTEFSNLELLYLMRNLDKAAI